MKAMEGVRRVTNRMELVQGLRSKLFKARLSLIAVTILLGVSAVTNVVMYNKLQDSKEVVAKQEVQITELENTIEVVETEREELAIKLDIANSFETLMDKVANLEDLALEAAHNAVNKIEGYVSNYLLKTDISYVDYVLDETDEEVKVSVRDRSFEFNYVVSRYRERAEKIRQEEENKPELIKKFNKFKNEFNKAGVKAIDSLIERLSN